MKHERLSFRLPLLIVALALLVPATPVRGQTPVDLTEHRKDSGIDVASHNDRLLINWPTGENETGHAALNLKPGEPLIQSLGLSRGQGAGDVRLIARRLDPVIVLTVGQRDPNKARRGMVFFDNPWKRPFDVYTAKLEKKTASVSSRGNRTTIRIGELTAGSFKGDYRITLYAGSPLLHIEAVMQTDEQYRAILYDAGLATAEPTWNAMAWLDPHGHLRRARFGDDFAFRPVGVKHRVLVAEGDHGCLAALPAPHQYFYPLDFADNFEFAWFGVREKARDDGREGDTQGRFGFGIHQPREGDRRFVPWFDAPQNTEQHLGVFFLLSADDAEKTIDRVARYTRGDRFKKLPDHVTFTSHYHVEHTVDFLNRQRDQKTASVPNGLEAPGFVTKFKEAGIDIAHLAEFHFGWTPGQKTDNRLKMLKTMHEECERLSDDEILILPGEEPNVHLGGHWISFFPKPVYWVLNRPGDTPFVQDVEGYGKVYHVGSAEDVHELMKRENGLMWTAHPRIKSSLHFPDGYREKDFYKSDRFLGAAWKAMPADLSRDRLGWRVLDLLDDMNNWGQRKHIVGEVDVFRVQPDYELYAHMNINYLRLDRVPKFEDGWQPVLDALRSGAFFTSTGEVLIPKFTVGGKQSGEVVKRGDDGKATLEADLEWTFPLAFAEIITGDGEKVHRQRIDLTDTAEFGSRKLRAEVDLTGKIWVRLEVWDIAANGVFTQPVWVE